MLNQYRKKPVVIEAVLWDGVYNRMKYPIWFSDAWAPYGSSDVGRIWKTDAFADAVCISTLEGIMRANRGDWIIRGVKGELYPCKPDIFAATYEALTTPAPQAEPTRESVRVLDMDKIGNTLGLDDAPQATLDAEVVEIEKRHNNRERDIGVNPDWSEFWCPITHDDCATLLRLLKAKPAAPWVDRERLARVLGAFTVADYKDRDDLWAEDWEAVKKAKYPPTWLHMADAILALIEGAKP